MLKHSKTVVTLADSVFCLLQDQSHDFPCLALSPVALRAAPPASVILLSILHRVWQTFKLNYIAIHFEFDGKNKQTPEFCGRCIQVGRSSNRLLDLLPADSGPAPCKSKKRLCWILVMKVGQLFPSSSILNFSGGSMSSL